MLESAIQSAIIEALRADGYYVVNVVVAGVAGTPDLIVCARGRFVALEVKQPGRYLKPVQKVQNALVERAGGAATLVRSVSEARLAVAAALRAAGLGVDPPLH